jgi:CRISPR type I-E-associated protein CasB/Cse2
MATTKLVTYLLNLREDPYARSALRRADSTQEDARAYKYLSPWWQGNPERREYILRYAALLSQHSKVADSEGNKFGVALRRLVENGVVRESSMDRRLIAAQSYNLEQFCASMRPMLAALDRSAIPISWNDFYWLLAKWEHPDQEVRRDARRGLLERYFQNNEQSKPPTPQPNKESE